jgi:hypothetical protein
MIMPFRMPRIPSLPGGAPAADMFSLKNNVAGIVGAVAGLALIGGFPGFLGGLVIGEIIDGYYTRVRRSQ